MLQDTHCCSPLCVSSAGQRSQGAVHLYGKGRKSTPTFNTPVRPHKRRPLRELVQVEGLDLPRTRLYSEHNSISTKRSSSWSQEEIKALLQFVLLHSDGLSWPTHHNMAIWNAAGSFIKMKLGTEHCRSGEEISY